MKKKRHFAGEDRVLRFAVLMMAALLVTGTAIVGLRMKNLRVDSSEGEKKLKELEKRDVQEIDEKIKKLEEEEEKALEERKNRTIEERFADCLILGDAVCQGIYEYECLDAGIVSAGQNLCVAAPDETGLFVPGKGFGFIGGPGLGINIAAGQAHRHGAGHRPPHHNAFNEGLAPDGCFFLAHADVLPFWLFCSNGRVTRTEVPWSFTESSSRAPPCILMISSATARPMPLPRRVVCPL